LCVAGAAFARDELTVEDQFMTAKRLGRTACSGTRAVIPRPLQVNLFPLFKLEAGRGPAPAG